MSTVMERNEAKPAAKAGAPYKVHGDVAVITLDNPPVNGLAHAVRKAVYEGIAAAEADAAVRAVVIMGAGSSFSGGADIKEFGTDRVLAEPGLHAMVKAIEDCAKPVVAAIHAVAMGAESSSRWAATIASRLRTRGSRFPR